MYKKNDILETVITDYTNEGLGVGKVNGFAFFVKDTVIGDHILLRVTKVKKTYGYARLEKILEPSDNRCEPFCKVSRSCGGCQLQAVRYAAQLDYKQGKVRNNLIRIGGFDESLIDSIMEPIIDAGEHTFGYRNKAQFPFGEDKDGNYVCGFFAGRTHSIISNTDCALGFPETKIILEAILAWMKRYQIRPYDEVSGKGYVRHALIRKGFRTGQIMVCLVVNDENLPKSSFLVKDLISLNETLENEYGSLIKSISYSVNTDNTNVIMGTSIKLLWGEESISDVMQVGGCKLKFNISPLSFYQVNPYQVEKLYNTAIDYASAKEDEEIWDLCCGIGTITLAMASRAKMVHGIEIVPKAIDDAIKNAKENGVENAEFIAAAAEDYLTQSADKIRADVIVMDPPRKGMDERALKVVADTKPSRIVYVSCDSATLARDLKYLCERGYELKRVRCCDMFSQTVHVESVCLMSRKEK